MLGIHDLALFILSGLLLNVTPGADTLFIVSHSVGRGWRVGAFAALGIGAGCCLHVLAATLCLSTLLATSATAFLVVKIVGAFYLVYMGWGLLRSARAHSPSDNGAAPTLSCSFRPPESSLPKVSRVFTQGFLTNALNPKVALFFLAFLPQFIEPGSDTPRALTFFALGLIFTVNGTIWCLALAWIAAHARSIRAPSQATRWLHSVTGLIFIGLGLKLAWTRAS
jgi:threonine/homoserine/homoserine lactone efflux protein